MGPSTVPDQGKKTPLDEGTPCPKQRQHGERYDRESSSLISYRSFRFAQNQKILQRFSGSAKFSDYSLLD